MNHYLHWAQQKQMERYTSMTTQELREQINAGIDVLRTMAVELDDIGNPADKILHLQKMQQIVNELKSLQAELENKQKPLH